MLHLVIRLSLDYSVPPNKIFPEPYPRCSEFERHAFINDSCWFFCVFVGAMELHLSFQNKCMYLMHLVFCDSVLPLDGGKSVQEGTESPPMFSIVNALLSILSLSISW